MFSSLRASWLLRVSSGGVVLGVLVAACGGPKPVPSIAGYGEAVAVAPESLAAPGQVLVPKGPPENWAYTEILGYPEYLIGRGDVLEVVFTHAGERTIEPVTVRPDGSIYFSLLEAIQASGLTPSQLDDVLTVELSELYRSPQVDVFVKEYNSKRVRVFGAVNIAYYTATRSGAGLYPLKGKTTVLDIILEAGGASPDARLDRVKLARGGRLYALDLERALLRGDHSQNVIVEGGDVINVTSLTHTGKKVVVVGEIHSPNIYPFSEDTRLLEAIAQAGGFTNFAVEDDVKIIRGGTENPEVLSLNVREIVEDADLGQNVLLQNGDIVYVPRTFLGDVNVLLSKINPILGLMIASYRDTRTLGGILGVDEKAPSVWETTTYPYYVVPGASKPAVPPSSDTESQTDKKE